MFYNIKINAKADIYHSLQLQYQLALLYKNKTI